MNNDDKIRLSIYNACEADLRDKFCYCYSITIEFLNLGILEIKKNRMNTRILVTCTLYFS